VGGSEAETDGFQLACRVAESNQLLDLKHLNCISWLGRYTTRGQSLSHCYNWFMRACDKAVFYFPVTLGLDSRLS